MTQRLALLLAGLLAVVTVAGGVGWWFLGRGPAGPLAEAMRTLPADSLRLGFTDWATVARDLDAPRGDEAQDEEVLTDFGVRSAGYLVTESLCEDWGTTPDWPTPRDWPTGERSAGITVLTVFDKKPGLDDHTFYGHWYDHQTPMSAAMQPRVRYVRNAVVRGLTSGAPPLRAIVEEAWPTVAHLTDPKTFFGAADDEGLEG